MKGFQGDDQILLVFKHYPTEEKWSISPAIIEGILFKGAYTSTCHLARI